MLEMKENESEGFYLWGVHTDKRDWRTTKTGVRLEESIKFLFKSLQIPFPCKSLLNLIERRRCNTGDQVKDGIPLFSFEPRESSQEEEEQFWRTVLLAVLLSFVLFVVVSLICFKLHWIRKTHVWNSSGKEMEFSCKVFFSRKKKTRRKRRQQDFDTKRWTKKTRNKRLTVEGRTMKTILSWGSISSGKQENDSTISSKKLTSWQKVLWIWLMIEK